MPAHHMTRVPVESGEWGRVERMTGLEVKSELKAEYFRCPRCGEKVHKQGKYVHFARIHHNEDTHGSTRFYKHMPTRIPMTNQGEFWSTGTEPLPGSLEFVK